MTAQVVEKWNPFAKIRQDLFGVIDIVALDGRSIIGIQCTSGSNHSARRKKIEASTVIPLWKQSGGVIKLISWHKVKNRFQIKEETL